MKKISIVVLALILALSLVPQAGWADTSPTTHRDMMSKLDFGFRNTLFGWSEIFRRPIHGYKAEGVVGGLKGLGTGVVYGVLDTVGGVLHIVTFPFPSIDIPLPEGGVQP